MCGGIIAVIPVKRLATAKGRLADVLSPEERWNLSLAMLADVRQALLASRWLSGVAIVTSDACVRDVAGVRVFWDPSDGGLNSALALAAKILAGENAKGMLVIPADLPMLTTEAVDRLCAGEADVVLSCDHTGTGTNALLVRPPEAIEFQFGNKSRGCHRVEVQRSGLSIIEMTIPEVAQDVDDFDDLLRLTFLEGRNHTLAWLHESGVATRLHDTTAGAKRA